MEQTLIILKPDAIQRGLSGEIISRFEQKGLKLLGIKMMSLGDKLLSEHYSEHLEKPFYADLTRFMKSSPVIVMAWEGYQCVESVRQLVGATNPRQADMGTIRGDLAIGQGRNLIHASDSSKAGKAEIARFFAPAELFKYDKSEYQHVYEHYERS